MTLGGDTFGIGSGDFYLPFILNPDKTISPQLGHGDNPPSFDTQSAIAYADTLLSTMNTAGIVIMSDGTSVQLPERDKSEHQEVPPGDQENNNEGFERDFYESHAGIFIRRFLSDNERYFIRLDTRKVDLDNEKITAKIQNMSDEKVASFVFNLNDDDFKLSVTKKFKAHSKDFKQNAEAFVSLLKKNLKPEDQQSEQGNLDFAGDSSDSEDSGESSNSPESTVSVDQKQPMYAEDFPDGEVVYDNLYSSGDSYWMFTQPSNKPFRVSGEISETGGETVLSGKIEYPFNNEESAQTAIEFKCNIPYDVKTLSKLEDNDVIYAQAAKIAIQRFARKIGGALGLGDSEKMDTEHEDSPDPESADDTHKPKLGEKILSGDTLVDEQASAWNLMKTRNDIRRRTEEMIGSEISPRPYLYSKISQLGIPRQIGKTIYVMNGVKPIIGAIKETNKSGSIVYVGDDETKVSVSRDSQVIILDIKDRSVATNSQYIFNEYWTDYENNHFEKMTKEVLTNAEKVNGKYRSSATFLTMDSVALEYDGENGKVNIIDDKNSDKTVLEFDKDGKISNLDNELLNDYLSASSNPYYAKRNIQGIVTTFLNAVNKTLGTDQTTTTPDSEKLELDLQTTTGINKLGFPTLETTFGDSAPNLLAKTVISYQNRFSIYDTSREPRVVLCSGDILDGIIYNFKSKSTSMIKNDNAMLDAFIQHISNEIPKVVPSEKSGSSKTQDDAFTEVYASARHMKINEYIVSMKAGSPTTKKKAGYKGDMLDSTVTQYVFDFKAVHKNNTHRNFTLTALEIIPNDKSIDQRVEVYNSGVLLDISINDINMLKRYFDTISKKIRYDKDTGTEFFIDPTGKCVILASYEGYYNPRTLAKKNGITVIPKAYGPIPRKGESSEIVSQQMAQNENFREKYAVDTDIFDGAYIKGTAKAQNDAELFSKENLFKRVMILVDKGGERVPVEGILTDFKKKTPGKAESISLNGKVLEDVSYVQGTSGIPFAMLSKDIVYTNDKTLYALCSRISKPNGVLDILSHITIDDRGDGSVLTSGIIVASEGPSGNIKLRLDIPKSKIYAISTDRKYISNPIIMTGDLHGRVTGVNKEIISSMTTPNTDSETIEQFIRHSFIIFLALCKNDMSAYYGKEATAEQEKINDMTPADKKIHEQTSASAWPLTRLHQYDNIGYTKEDVIVPKSCSKVAQTDNGGGISVKFNCNDKRIKNKSFVLNATYTSSEDGVDYYQAVLHGDIAATFQLRGGELITPRLFLDAKLGKVCYDCLSDSWYSYMNKQFVNLSEQGSILGHIPVPYVDVETASSSIKSKKEGYLVSYLSDSNGDEPGVYGGLRLVSHHTTSLPDALEYIKNNEEALRTKFQQLTGEKFIRDYENTPVEQLGYSNILEKFKSMSALEKKWLIDLFKGNNINTSSLESLSAQGTDDQNTPVPSEDESTDTEVAQDDDSSVQSQSSEIEKSGNTFENHDITLKYTVSFTKTAPISNRPYYIHSIKKTLPTKTSVWECDFTPTSRDVDTYGFKLILNVVKPDNKNIDPFIEVLRDNGNSSLGIIAHDLDKAKETMLRIAENVYFHVEPKILYTIGKSGKYIILKKSYQDSDAAVINILNQSNNNNKSAHLESSIAKSRIAVLARNDPAFEKVVVSENELSQYMDWSDVRGLMYTRNTRELLEPTSIGKNVTIFADSGSDVIGSGSLNQVNEKDGYVIIGNHKIDVNPSTVSFIIERKPGFFTTNDEKIHTEHLEFSSRSRLLEDLEKLYRQMTLTSNGFEVNSVYIFTIPRTLRITYNGRGEIWASMNQKDSNKICDFNERGQILNLVDGVEKIVDSNRSAEKIEDVLTVVIRVFLDAVKQVRMDDGYVGNRLPKHDKLTTENMLNITEKMVNLTKKIHHAPFVNVYFTNHLDESSCLTATIFTEDIVKVFKGDSLELKNYMAEYPDALFVATMDTGRISSNMENAVTAIQKQNSDVTRTMYRSGSEYFGYVPSGSRTFKVGLSNAGSGIEVRLGEYRGGDQPYSAISVDYLNDPDMSGVDLPKQAKNTIKEAIQSMIPRVTQENPSENPSEKEDSGSEIIQEAPDGYVKVGRRHKMINGEEVAYPIFSKFAEGDLVRTGNKSQDVGVITHVKLPKDSQYAEEYTLMDIEGINGRDGVKEKDMVPIGQTWNIANLLKGKLRPQSTRDMESLINRTLPELKSSMSFKLSTFSAIISLNGIFSNIPNAISIWMNDDDGKVSWRVDKVNVDDTLNHFKIGKFFKELVSEISKLPIRHQEMYNTDVKMPSAKRDSGKNDSKGEINGNIYEIKETKSGQTNTMRCLFTNDGSDFEFTAAQRVVSGNEEWIIYSLTNAKKKVELGTYDSKDEARAAMLELLAGISIYDVPNKKIRIFYHADRNDQGEIEKITLLNFNHNVDVENDIYYSLV